MTWLGVRAPKGTRCNDDVSGGQRKTMTSLGAIRGEGLIEDAPVIADGARDGQMFLTYVENCPTPAAAIR